MGDLAGFWKRVLALDRALDRRTHYQLLGVTLDSDISTVRDAYKRLAHRFDPKRRAAAAEPERLAALERVHRRLGEASRVLCSPELRDGYDRWLSEGRRGPDPTLPNAGIPPAGPTEPDFAREDTRLPVARPIKVRCARWEQVATLYTRDISRGGLFLKTRTPLPLGTSITVDVTLPDATAIQLEAEVVRAVHPGEGEGSHPGMGVRFAPLPAGAEEQFEEIIRALAPPEPEEPLEPDEPPEPPAPPRRARRPSSPGEHAGLPTRSLLDDRARAELDSGTHELPPEPASVEAPHVAEATDAATAFDVSQRMRGIGAALADIRAGRYAEARSRLARILKDDPDNRYLRANYHLAIAYEAKGAGHTEVARKHFQAVLKYDKKCKEAIIELRASS